MRRTVQDVKPYHAPYITDGIKLDANENTYPVSQGLREHMAKWCMEMPIHYYPDTENRKLREAIGEAYGFKAENVICGVGSDQLIDCILRAFVEQDDWVMAPSPSFSMYGLSTKINEGRFVAVPLQADYTYDVEAMVEAIERLSPKVLFICNPNNPTGTLLEQSSIEKLIQKAQGIVVMDEAYAEFSGETMLPLIHKYPHVIVLRTFSKAYGLAGARIGYGIASEEMIESLDAIRPPYNVNSFSQEVAHYVITHREQWWPVIERIKASRDEMREKLMALGFKVAPSYTNFLWIETELPLDQVLREEKIYVKLFTYEGIQYFRLSIGTEVENGRVLEILTQLIKERG